MDASNKDELIMAGPAVYYNRHKDNKIQIMLNRTGIRPQMVLLEFKKNLRKHKIVA